MSLATLGEILVLRGDGTGGLQAFEETLEILAGVLPRHHWRIADALSERAVLLAGQGLYREAERDLLEAQRSLAVALGDGHPRTRRAVERLVELYTAWDGAHPGGDHGTALEEWLRVLDAGR